MRRWIIALVLFPLLGVAAQFNFSFWKTNTGGAITPYLTNLDSGYSFLLLRGTYTGPCLRVRRASDNAEQNIGFVSGTLNTAALASFCSGTDGFVTTWYDQIISNDFIQTTAGFQPKIVANGVVLPDILFDGVDDYMAQTNNSAASAKLTSLFAGRIRYTGAATSSRAISRFDYSGPIFTINSSAWKGVIAGPNTGFKTYGSYSNPSQPDSVYTTACDPSLGIASGLLFYVNGVLQSEIASSGTTSGSFTATKTYIGGKYDQTEFASMAVRSFLSYKDLVSPSDIASISAIIRPALTPDLLDNFTTNLWSAVSFSRRVRSNYAGPIIRIRRASDNTEQDIGVGANGLLDTAAANTFCAGTNGFLRTGYDQSGNGNNWVQTTAANQPKVYDSVTGLNTTVGALFDPTNDSLSTPNNSGTPSAFTYYLRGTLVTSSGGIMEHSVNFNSFNATTSYYDSGAISTGIHTTTGNGYTTNNYNTFPAFVLLGVAFQADRSQLTAAAQNAYYIGGKVITPSSTSTLNTLPAGNFDAKPWYLNSRAGTSFFSNAQYGEIYIYETAHSAATINLITYFSGG